MWRVLHDFDVEHDQGLATDDALARLAGKKQTVSLRLYTLQACALIGRFQRVEHEVSLDRCRALKVPINRRPSGGGAIIMGPKQLGIALVFGSKDKTFTSISSQLIRQCARGIVNALCELGIESRFQGKNDLVVNNRKIAGLGLYQAPSGGKLFHASLLLDLDLDFMLNVLRTPFEKTKDKGFSTVSERITTINAESRTSIDMSELMECVQRGYMREFTTSGKLGRLDEDEIVLSTELCEQQYATDQWIFQNSTKVRDQVGTSKVRTAGGSLEVRAIVAGETIKSVFLSGDFIASNNAVADLESSLRWHVREFSSLQQTITNSIERNSHAWNQISTEDLTTAVVNAVDLSQEIKPHACFANQGVAYV